MQRASLGEMLKNEASNWSMSARNPPFDEQILPLLLNSMTSQRPGGMGAMAETHQVRN
jgi:hypothetical protein